MTRLLLYMGVYLIAGALHAQVDDLSIRRITTLNGLSHNDVECVFQDSRGFIWLGTTDGLNRYDGHSFQIFQMDPGVPGSLPSNIVFSISEDENHILWIGTRQHEVCFFDLKTDRFVPAASLPAQYHLPTGFIFGGVAHAGNGEHWICGNRDILISSPDTIRSLMQERILPPDLKGDIQTIVSNQANLFWVSVQAGPILRLSQDESGQLSMKRYLNLHYANDCLPYQDGLILSSFDGIYAVSPWYDQLVQVSTLSSFKLYIQEKTLWAGTLNALWMYPSDSILAPFFNKPTPPSPTPPHPLAAQAFRKKVPRYWSQAFDIYGDRQGMIWLGTKGDGVLQLNAQPGRFRRYPLNGQRGVRNRVRSVFEDHLGRVWVGTDGKGMFQLQTLPDGSRYLGPASPYGIQDRLIHKLDEFTIRGTSYLFQGGHYPSRHCLFTMDGDELIEASSPKALLSIVGNATDIQQDSPWIWVSTYDRGIYRYDYVADDMVNIRMLTDTNVVAENKTRSLLADSQGRLWIGTSRGLYMVPREEKAKAHPRMTVFQYDADDPHSLSHDYILPLFESAKGDIWIGTMGGGLNRWIDSSQTFEHWTTAEGLPSNTLKGILEDAQGNLWISSHKGISHFLLDEKRFINYDITDGLQDFEFADLSCWKSKTGEMFFGGIRGVNAFFPEDIREDTSASHVILTDLQILNERVAPQQLLNGRPLLTTHLHETPSIELSYDESSFTLSFVGLNYQSPRKIRYQYRLKGFDDVWNQTSAKSRFAKYTKIPPGKYEFQVRASNTDGLWNGPIKTLLITITPPWWRSWVAYVCYFLLIVAFIVFSRRYSLIRIKRKNELVMQQFETEKVQELAKMKLQFFTNASHELRTPLTLIQGYVEKVIAAIDGAARRDLHIIRRNTRILLRLVSELMDLQKLDQGKETLRVVSYDVDELARQSLDSFQWWAKQKGIQLNLHSPAHPLPLWIDPHKIEHVFYNLLSNALKHTPAEGTVMIHITESEECVSISVQDTGGGIPQADQAYVFRRFYQATNLKELHRTGTGIGLAYAKAIIEQHQGTLSFDSSEGVGTTFSLTLPKGKSHLEQMEGVEFLFVESPVSVRSTDGELLHMLQAETWAIQPEERDVNAPHILLVEDNVPIRTMLKELLGQLYHVHEAEEGEAALAFCLRRQPDLVISDVMMPGMDGFTFCAALKTNRQISHIPVILLTAKDSPEMKRQGYEQGADAYVTKPFDIAVLKAQIKAVMESREKLREQIIQSGYNIELKDVQITPSEAQFMEQLVAVMEAHISKADFSVVQFAESLNMSKSTFNRKLKALTGHTALSFMRDYRIKRAAQLLTQTDLSIKEVFYQTGVANMHLFRTYFKEAYGLSPKEYQAKHQA